MAHNLLFEVIIQQVIRRIGQVTGTSVQIYAEDLIGDMIQHKFDVMFEEVWWSQFMHWLDGTLDGTTGVVTIDMLAQVDSEGRDSGLKRFEDIHSIYPANSNTPLSRFPDRVNPDNVTGERARYIEADPNEQKVFHVYPLAATGIIKIHYRSKPDPFVVGDIIRFDNQALILGSAYDYLEDDGTNPGATEKMSSMFESRVRQLKKSRAWLPHKLDPRVDNAAPDEWFAT